MLSRINKIILKQSYPDWLKNRVTYLFVISKSLNYDYNNNNNLTLV